LGFDWIHYFLRFNFAREIRQPNHCWLLLVSPFQCLVVSPVELTGFNCVNNNNNNNNNNNTSEDGGE